MPATGRKRQLQHHIVIRVGQERPPEEMDFLKVRLARQIPQETHCIVGREPRRDILRPRQNLLPLSIQPN
jgi:hypothetical protein